MRRSMSDKRPDVFKAITPGYTRVVDKAQGIVEAIVSVTGVRDAFQDIIKKGAFAKTLVERGPKVRVLDAHDTSTTLSVIGIPLEMREVEKRELPKAVRGRFPDATGGLLVRTQFLMDTERGREVFSRIAAGAVNEWSIGFDIIDSEYPDGEPKSFEEMLDELPTRVIKEVRLWEYSPVIWGANPATETLNARSLQPGAADLGAGEHKRVPALQSYPLAARARAWDGAGAERRWRTASDSEEAPSARYRNGFFWFDQENADQFGSYKLGYVDVIDGTATAIPRGLFAVAQRLDGTDIPDSDKAAIQRQLSTWYARMREEFDDDTIVPPWEVSLDVALEIRGVVDAAGQLLNAISRANALLQSRTITMSLDVTALEGMAPEQIHGLYDAIRKEAALRGLTLTFEIEERAGSPAAPAQDSADLKAGPSPEGEIPTEDVRALKDAIEARRKRLDNLQ